MPAATKTVSPPDCLDELLERFDPTRMHVPGGRARIRLAVDEDEWDAVIASDTIRLRRPTGEPDARIQADSDTWERLARDPRSGLGAFKAGRLAVRDNLHLGIGFIAAVSGGGESSLRFGAIEHSGGTTALAAAGDGPAVLCLHGLGGTKASFMPTLAALAGGYRVIAIDLPGFGDSSKPIRAAYDASFFANWVQEVMDTLELERVHLVGNSMGGRIAIELGLCAPDRVERLVLLSPALAWLRDRGWATVLGLPLPKLGLIQPVPRRLTEAVVRRLVPGGTAGWTAAGVDEFLRSYLTPRGRHAFYEAARRIYLDEPHGEAGFWTRLGELSPDTMFVWGRRDTLVPISFMRHVEEVLPRARHLELDCGHVPQLEAPGATHRAMREFFGAKTRSSVR
jgi:pimeloyl-ACP methyl ester carboxylesterase